MGHNIQQKKKKLATKQYDKKLFVLFYVANFQALKHNAKK